MIINLMLIKVLRLRFENRFNRRQDCRMYIHTRIVHGSFLFLDKKRGSDDKHHFPKSQHTPLKAIGELDVFYNIYSN